MPDNLSLFSLLAGIALLLTLVAITLASTVVRNSFLAMLGVIAGAETAITLIISNIPEDMNNAIRLVIAPVLMMLFLTPLILRLRADSRNLLAEKNRVQITLESIPDAVIGVDSHNRVDYLNASAQVMTGWPSSSAQGKLLTEVLRLKESPASSETHTNEAVRTLLCRDGNTLQIELSVSSSQRSGDSRDVGQIIAFRDISPREQVRLNLLVSNEYQRQLNQLLQIKSRDRTLSDILHDALDVILSTQWLGVTSKGAIFLTEQDIQLVLAAQRNLEPELLSSCALVPFGHCLCGKAALNRKISFTPCIDSNHEIRHTKMEEHGHYQVPLISGDVVIGLLMLYVEQGHHSTPEELGFLEAVSTTLSSLIVQKRSEERIQYLAYYDQLTGLCNRQRLNDNLDYVIACARRQQSGVAVMLLDLDRFKDVNDGLGHSRGDLLLVEAARRLKACTRDSDIVARQGGDEFAIVLSEVACDPAMALSQTNAMWHRIRDELAQPYSLDGHDFVLTTCIGVSFHPSDANNAADLLKHANAAMQHAKASGRGVFQAYSSEMNKDLAERLTMEKDLRVALVRNQLTLVYQPRVDMTTGQINGAEALIRWPHPEKGMISPAKFIPVAEDTGLIIDIGTWVIRTACEQMAIWARNGNCRGLEMVSVNVSPLQFRQPNFCEIVRTIVAETGVTPERLELELTEGMLMHNKEAVLDTLNELKSVGIHLAIDDFGTGYSSLSYLKRFPVDVLKIDQSFVRDIASDSDDAEIVRAIIDMAKALRLKVIAEGVESLEQLEFLRAHHCESYQGYYFSRPVPAGEIQAMLTTQPQSVS